LSFKAHLTLDTTLEGSKPRELKIDAAPGGSGKPNAGPSVSRYLAAVLKPGRPPVFNKLVTCGGNCCGINCGLPSQPSTSTPIVLIVKNPFLGTLTVAVAVAGN
jgi:hypothetical protein